MTNNLFGKALGRMNRSLNLRSLGLVIFIAILWAFLAVLSPYFFRASNIMILLLQTSTVMVSGVGLTFVILSGGTDLSVGSVAAVSGMVTGISVTHWGWSAGPSVLVGLLTGTAFGAFNGLMIARFKLQPMVCTLGTMSIARGLTLISTSGRSLFVLNPTLNRIGNGKWFGVVPYPVVVAFIVFLIGYIILNYTFFGRNIYSIGGNEEAARLSGIDVVTNKVVLYAITGCCAAIVGVMLVCQLGASEPTVGTGLELDSIAVTAIGGTSLMGGVGGLVGTIFGSILIGTIKNGLTILNIVSYYQQLIIGVVIIFAVLLENLKKDRN